MEDGEAPDKPLDNAVLGRLKQFKAMHNFKKVALRVPTISLCSHISLVTPTFINFAYNHEKKPQWGRI